MLEMQVMPDKNKLEQINEYWGYHLILDCKQCDIDRITDRSVVASFVKTLVKRIDMKAFGEPIIEHFADHDLDKAGFSLLQLIETSSITGHFVNKTGDAYLDVFSCKPFDIELTKEVVIEFFNPTKIKTFYLTRQA
jgi:S-adenosylmethionine decarboxylase